MGRSRVRRGARVAVAVATLLAGCALGGTTEPAGDSTGGGAERPSGGSDDARGDRSEWPDFLRECRPAADRDEGEGAGDAVTAPVSLAALDHALPADFDYADGYYTILPAEGGHTTTYMIPPGDRTLDLLAIVHYPQLENGPVVDECDRLDRDEVTERVEAFRVAAGAERLTEIEWQELDGAPVAVELLRYPDHGFDVWVYWLYGVDELVVISCQWQSKETEILDGCEELLASIVIG